MPSDRPTARLPERVHRTASPCAHANKHTVIVAAEGNTISEKENPNRQERTHTR